jgi:hypothetical protein
VIKLFLKKIEAKFPRDWMMASIGCSNQLKKESKFSNLILKLILRYFKRNFLLTFKLSRIYIYIYIYKFTQQFIFIF